MKWVLVLIAAILGFLFFLFAFLAAESAIQEAAAAAVGVAIAVIPYIMARAIQELGKGGS